MPKIIKHNECNLIYSSDNKDEITFDYNNKSNVFETEKLSTVEANKMSCEIVNDALKKARNIMETVHEYSTSYIKTQNEIIEEKRDKLNKQGFLDGYNQGLHEGNNKGYDDGFNQGYASGQLKAINEQKDKLDNLDNLINQIKTAKEIILKEFEQDIINLSVAIGEKITKATIDITPDIIKNMIQDSLENYKNQKWVKISVSQTTKDMLSQNNDFLDMLSNVSSDIRISEENELSDYDVLIETPNGVIDLGVDLQIKNIKDEFSKVEYEYSSHFTQENENWVEQ